MQAFIFKFMMFSCMLVFFHALQAQDVLPRDETGHIVFYEVVEADSFTKEDLLGNAQNFIKEVLDKKKGKTSKSDSLTTLFVKGANFEVLKKMITNRADGIIHYNFKLEAKDGKYRYFFSDFTFQPLERNRYGKFVPVSGKYKPLEEDYKGHQKDWEHHKETVAITIQSQIEELKRMMQYRPENITRKEEKKPEAKW